MPSRIYIRADGSSVIGLGHLVRCMALGHMLKSEHEIHFFCLQAPESIIAEIVKEFSFHKIEKETDFLANLEGSEIVVLDHYGLGSEYQKAVKSKGCKLVCIDDLHDKQFYADLIINHSPGIKVQDYKAQAYTKFALGLEYALLKPVFLAQAKEITERSNAETLFLCFGGSDPRNFTQLVLNNLLKDHSFKTIFVVTGSAYLHHEQLKAETANHPVVVYNHNLKDVEMLELMAKSEFALVPSSGILLECLATGCKVITSSYVDNQRRILQGLIDLEAIIAVNVFLDLPKNIFSEAAAMKLRSVIDGLSDTRMVKLFQQINLEKLVRLRPATEKDLGLTFNWASNKTLRAFAFKKDEITFEGHTAWFLSKINSNECFYFIAEWNGQAVGSIRFDLLQDEAIISYLVDTNFQRRGLGNVLLKLGILAIQKEKSFSGNKIIGYVMPENIASVKAFERFGFKRTEEEGKIRFTLLKSSC